MCQGLTGYGCSQASPIPAIQLHIDTDNFVRNGHGLLDQSRVHGRSGFTLTLNPKCAVGSVCKAEKGLNTPNEAEEQQTPCSQISLSFTGAARQATATSTSEQDREASAYLVGFHEGTLLFVSPQRDLPLCHHCLLGWLHTTLSPLSRTRKLQIAT